LADNSDVVKDHLFNLMMESSLFAKGNAVKSHAQKYNPQPQTFASRFESLDVAQKEIITRGLDVQAEFNTVCAVEYLKAHDIDGDVIQHVLLPRD
jgi:hypothetical protein